MTQMAPNPLGSLKLYVGKECIQLDLKTEESKAIVWSSNRMSHCTTSVQAWRPETAMPDAECFGLHALYRLYPAREGWVFLACLFDDEWQAFCSATGRADLAADARFATADARSEHDSELAAEIAPLFAGRTADEWEALLTAAGVACVRADVDSGQFFEEHPQSVANHLAVQTESPRVGNYTRHGGIIQFSDAPGRFEHGAFQGEHTVSVMLELGYSHTRSRRSTIYGRSASSSGKR